MEILLHTLEHACADCLRMLPFLFAAFLLIEGLEHYSGKHSARIMEKVGKAGPVVGAAAGCVPQCGFSVMAANLYAGGVISVGTLLAVFLATSDEAVLILLGNPQYAPEVGRLLAVKVVIAIAGGYVADLCLKDRLSGKKEEGVLCVNCGCHVAKMAKTASMGASSRIKGLYLPKRVLVFCSSLLKNGWMISPNTLAIRQIHAP